MPRTTALLATAATGLLLATAGPAAADATPQQIAAGAGWIESKQDPDGTFNPGFSSFDPTATSLAAAGRHPADVDNGNDSLQEALLAALANPANANHPTNTGAFQNAILSAHAAGLDPARSAPGENLAADLGSTYASGYFGDPSIFNSVAFGTLALNRLQAPRFLLDRSVAVIRANQHDDGGWDFTRSDTPDTRDDPGSVELTGATMAALCESGVSLSDPAVQRAVDFLKGTIVPASGALVSPGPFGSANANANGWAVSGLNACGLDPEGPGFDANQTPVDYLISLQDDSGGVDDGSFLYSDPPPVFAPGPDLPSSRDALRALAGAAFTADPPSRTNPSLPRRHTPPTVADGTQVAIALAVDDGAGGITYCRVNVPSGSSLATLLATANGASTPGGCATGGEYTAGSLSKLNGQSGSWAMSVDGGPEQIAASQPVRFGDFVALRRTGGAAAGVPPGAGGGGNVTAVPAAQQAKTAPTGVASKSLKASRRKRVVTVSLRCAKDNRLCQGVVYLVYRKRTLGRRAFLIGGGKTTRVKVKLYRSQLKRLGKKRRRVKVNTFSRDGAGIASTSSRTITLRTTK